MYGEKIQLKHTYAQTDNRRKKKEIDIKMWYMPINL
jgi:hypothetical protein